MKNNWQKVKLGDICNVNNRVYSISENWNFANYLDTGNITKNIINEFLFINLKTDKLPSRARRKVKNGNIIYSTVRPNQEHYGYIVSQPKNLLVSTAFAVLDINPECADSKFIYYLITQTEYTNLLQSVAEQSTTAYPSIKPSDITSLEIIIPPLDEQRKIAGILSALDDKIELNNKINRNLEAQAQAIFKSWFIDFEPFKNGKFIDSELGRIPEGWDIGTIGDISIISTGKRPDKKSVNKSNETPIPIIGASSIMGYTNKALYDEKILITGRVGTHGIIQKIDSPCWPSDNTLVLRSKNLNFLHNCLLLINWKSMNRGSTQPLITQNDLKNIRIILPQDGIIQNYEQLVHYFDIKFHNNNKEIYSLSQIRDLLLPKLMSGEVNISD